MRIYLSYRSQDGLGWPNVLRERLTRRYWGRRAVDSTAAGQPETAEAVASRIAQYQALIVLIGPSWHAGWEGNDAQRVRQEISAARQSRIQVFAVRVGGTAMPDIEQLPPELHFLVELQAPGLTVETKNTILEDLQINIDPESRVRIRRRLVDMLASAAFSAVIMSAFWRWWMWPRSDDEPWLRLMAPAEFGAPPTKYFQRTFESLPIAWPWTSPSQRWDALPAAAFFQANGGDFLETSTKDEVTFIFDEHGLFRVSLRFCERADARRIHRFSTFASLARATPSSEGSGEHFEALGTRVDLLGWSGPGFTAVDIVQHGHARFGDKPWFDFLSTVARVNQCGT